MVLGARRHEWPKRLAKAKSGEMPRLVFSAFPSIVGGGLGNPTFTPVQIVKLHSNTMQIHVHLLIDEICHLQLLVGIMASVLSVIQLKCPLQHHVRALA